MEPLYAIGIDLGTTNSVIAYADAQPDARGEIEVFRIPQLVGPGEIRELPALPSFLYFPSDAELTSGTLALPWEAQPQFLAGVLAREQGALIPGHQVTSAKSWLSHAGADRRAKILPWQAERMTGMVSPVEASTAYLTHLKNAWNHTIAALDRQRQFERQEIVLTVPASFDEEARELTVEAAHRAGLEHLVLLEEPLAAFYEWIASHQQLLQTELRDGDLILICDIGGGTTDFSLVRTRRIADEVQFERVAIGDHLLLGGDNLDLALAHRVEEKLKGATLSLRQRQALRRACCAAKERLLGEEELDRLPIAILGGGGSVVGQMLQAELTRDELLELLISGFLPPTAADDLPARGRPMGLRELSLPYASDPAITRHLASFLTQAAKAMQSEEDMRNARSGPGPVLARPDAILFNGGFCAPRIVRERLAEAVAGWFPEADWHPKILPSEAMSSAVAKGAACYGRVRRGAGQRIRAGSARTYYIGLRSEERLEGVCVLPAGVEEGTTLPPVRREFSALANRPVSFTLFSSKTRHDAHGEVAVLEPGQVHRHAPLVTLLRYGKKLRELELAVRLHASFTEVGTLELWCEALNSPHRWRLQFELRGDEGQSLVPERGTPKADASQLPTTPAESAAHLLRLAFRKPGEVEETEEISPEALMGKLESSLGLKKERWPVAWNRSLCDMLAEVAEGRRQSVRHEVRWLNLLGFCLRPGFGAPGDEARVGRFRKLYSGGPVYPRESQPEVERLVVWRRIAGGLNASQQQELYRELRPLLGPGSKKKGGRLNSQVEYEGWRLLASLEHLPATLRTALGNELLARAKKDAPDSRWLWSLARIGARIPLYGPIACVVPASTATEWLRALLELPGFNRDAAYAAAQLGRYTSDPLRDVDAALREAAVAKLHEVVGDELILIHPLLKLLPPETADAARMFGESLPPGLQLVTSPDCLLTVPALVH